MTTEANVSGRAPLVLLETRRRSPARFGVTIAISAHNYAHYLAGALESVHAQTHADLDLVVVDDGSSDDTIDRARSWMDAHADRFGQATLLSHATNRGLAQARNAAFGRSRYEWVFVLDADNELYPTAIRRLFEAALHSRAQAAYSQLEFFDEARTIGAAGVWNPRRLALGNYIDAMAIVRRSAWRRAGGYHTFTVPGLEDFDLWCSFVDHGLEAVYVPEILCRYRVHGASMYRRVTAPGVGGLRDELTARHPWLTLA